jgi:hypothetical protein
MIPKRLNVFELLVRRELVKARRRKGRRRHVRSISPSRAGSAGQLDISKTGVRREETQGAMPNRPRIASGVASPIPHNLYGASSSRAQHLRPPADRLAAGKGFATTRSGSAGDKSDSDGGGGADVKTPKWPAGGLKGLSFSPVCDGPRRHETEYSIGAARTQRSAVHWC